MQSPSHIVAVMMLPGEEKKFIQSQLQWQKDMDDILRHTILNHSIEAVSFHADHPQIFPAK